MPSRVVARVAEEADGVPEPVAEVTVELLVTAKQHGAESLAAAAITRLVRAIVTAVSNHPHGLMKVVSAPTDLQAMLTLFEDPAIIEHLSRIDPLAPAIVRGILRKSELYQAEGGCVSGDEAARLVNVSRQSIDKARKRGEVFALPRGADGWTYPVWQFTSGHYLPGLSDVLKVLQEHGAFVQASFLLSTNYMLDGERPLEYLQRGDLTPVLRAANAFGEHGSA